MPKKKLNERRVALSRRNAGVLTEAVMLDKVQGGPALCTHVWAGYFAAKAGISQKELLAADLGIEYDRSGSARYLVLSGPDYRSGSKKAG